MTADEERLREHVRALAASSHREADSYIDRHGRFFTPAPLSELHQLMRIVGKGTDCYGKSRVLADADSTLEYVEGYGLAPDGVPTKHAWCVDSEGRVIDAEWPDSEQLTYFGVVVPRTFGYAWRGTFTPLEALAIEGRNRSLRRE